MSAICGLFTHDQRPVEPLEIERMVDILAHRGPDGSGAWNQGPVGLGHQLLSTTPEAHHESFPLVDPEHDLALTADARIDNRDELIATLELPTDEAPGDGQLILAAYRKWGERCAEHLLGDFAFALWDGRNQVLFCARDHYGIKPLYYHRRPGRLFIFGTEIKALLAHPDVPRRLNEVRVGDYLLPILEDREITFYEEILRLPPAHSMTIARDGFFLRCYWELDPERRIRLRSDEEYAEAFREIFTEAVACRLRGGVPVASMLSGGLDSSSIAAVARNRLAADGAPPLHTVSAIFDEVKECDEREYIHPVLEQGDVEPHFVNADHVSPMVDLDRMFGHADQAFYAPNHFMHWALYREAQQHGTRIILDGFDGDTTVSHGIPIIHELLRRGRWIAMVGEIRELSRNFHLSPAGLFWRRGIKPLIPESARKLKRILTGESQRLRKPLHTLREDFIERIGLVERERRFLEHRTTPPRTVVQQHYIRLTAGVIPFMLELCDSSASAFQMESRFPFFDKRLMEFCLALPADQKVRGGWTRFIMRRAMDPILPKSVCWRRKKSDLSGNFRKGLLHHERDRLEDVILHNPREIEPYVDIEALRRIYRRYESDPTDEDAIRIWKPTTLALWLRKADFG